MAYKFFAITRGKETGVYSSFDAANQQLRGYPGPEFVAFNSHLLAKHAFESRMEIFQDAREAVAVELAANNTSPSPPHTPRTVPTARGLLAPMVS
ncbi:hypothetical protein PIB30_076011, partial [Stylosanthes scabra]|nr:hypothetical protein [Stylosanthes scabra]